ncbi:MAG: hypothetical protein PHX83_07125 [Acidobacteriia bacterium]|nr:hypothetical protein [Terriglobia bacterium]
MTDHCLNCTVRGDLSACEEVCERDNCDVPLSWGAAARIDALSEARRAERAAQRTFEEADEKKMNDLRREASMWKDSWEVQKRNNLAFMDDAEKLKVIISEAATLCRETNSRAHDAGAVNMAGRILDILDRADQ